MVGSLITGDNALIAISTRRRRAYLGSCSNVRSRCSCTARRGAALGSAALAISYTEEGVPFRTVTHGVGQDDDSPHLCGQADQCRHVIGGDLLQGRSRIRDGLCHRRDFGEDGDLGD